jgi:hypothetical protein
LPVAVVSVTAELIEQTLSGAYAIRDEGSNYSPCLSVRAAAVERAKNEPEAAFYPALGRAAMSVQTG